MDGSEVGSSQGGSVCIRTEPTDNVLHVMEAMQNGHGVGCTSTTMDVPWTCLLLPAMEPHSSSATESMKRESGGDHHHPILAISTLVPHSVQNVNNKLLASPKRSSEASPRKHARPFGKKSNVVTYCMEHKWQALMQMGTDNSIITMWMTMQPTRENWHSVWDLSYSTSNGLLHAM